MIYSPICSALVVQVVIIFSQFLELLNRVPKGSFYFLFTLFIRKVDRIFEAVLDDGYLLLLFVPTIRTHQHTYHLYPHYYIRYQIISTPFQTSPTSLPSILYIPFNHPHCSYLPTNLSPTNITAIPTNHP